MSELIKGTIQFSIHASAKEATLIQPEFFATFCVFNPRLREGGDQTGTTVLLQQERFQSTPPRRRRQEVSKWKHDQEKFSIHASAKEATCYYSGES